MSKIMYMDNEYAGVPPVISVAVTWDRFSGDGYAGYITASTLGVSDPTEYYWWISEQPTWQQFNQIQAVGATELTMRCWYMASATNGQVKLLQNTKPSAFRLIGIKKS